MAVPTVTALGAAQSIASHGISRIRLEYNEALDLSIQKLWDLEICSEDYEGEKKYDAKQDLNLRRNLNQSWPGCQPWLLI